MGSNLKTKLFLISILTIIFSTNFFAQTTIISDPLNGSTKGTRYGGSINSSGYTPGTGKNHILYKSSKIVNGYVEFEVKGFNPSKMPANENHGFAVLYDGRGFSEPIKYGPDFNDGGRFPFRENFFRWNFHWRQNRNAFKHVISTAKPGKPLVRGKANFDRGVNSKWVSWENEHRDWEDEPTGKGWNWNSSTWYKVKIEWRNKVFTISVNGTKVLGTKTAVYDYAPEELRIWLGSGPGKYDADLGGVSYRNFKLVSYGGSTTPPPPPSNTLSVSPSSRSVGSASGSTTFSVSSNVSWTVSDNQGWLSVSPTSGSNGGTLTAKFDENTSTSSRTATITTKSSTITRTVTVTQAGKSTSGSSLALSPSSRSVGSGSGSTSFSVSSNVSWTVSDNQGWLSVSPTSGSNNGSLTANYSANTGTSSRTATITTKGGGLTRTVTVTQAGKSSSTSNYITVIETKNISSSQGSFSVDVMSNVDWVVRDNTGATGGWISKSPKTGSGNGKVTVSHKANTSSKSRTGNLIFTGGGLTKIVAIVQAGQGSTTTNSLALSPSSKSVGANAGSTSYSLSSNVSWSVADNQGWVTLSPTSGSNSGSVTASFSKNSGSSSRTATITATGGGLTKSVTLVQAGSGTTPSGNYITVPSSKNLPKTGSSFVLDVASNVSWTVRDNSGVPGWISKGPKTGSGNGKVTVRFYTNSGDAARTAQLIFTGGGVTSTMDLIQDGQKSSGGTSGTPYLTVMDTKNLPSSSGTFTVSVSSNVEWTVRDNTGTPGWISKSPKTGNGNGSVKVTYYANTGSSSRTGELIFTAGSLKKVVNLTQSGKTSLALSKSNGLQAVESIEEVEELPTKYSLSNYPNPFNPTTRINYQLPSDGFTQLTIYNSIGQEIKQLISEYKTAGSYEVQFNGSNLSSGLYFYVLSSGKFKETKKMLLLE